MTLGDRIFDFNEKYIRRTQENPIVAKTVEDKLTDPPLYTSYKSKYSNKLSPEKRRKLALTCGLFVKGSIKKNSDTFRAWFELKQFDGIKVPQADLELVRAFEIRSQIKKKFKIAGICADIWGDGYLLIKYKEIGADGKLIIDTDLKSTVQKDAEPLDLLLLNPENITEYKPQFKNDSQYYYHYYNTEKSEDKWIHPDRIVHIKVLELPFDYFGISKVDILKNILISNEDVDIATGEILKWFSHGTHVLTKNNMQKNERDKALKMMEAHPNYYAFSEKYKLDIINPTSINPTPFYDHISEAISAALIIPRQVLLGIEIGRVTGAEIGFADYYRDIKDNQELVYTPHILRIYDLLAKSRGRDFSKYTISWNVTYIDEMAEAELMGKRVAAVVNARSANPPLISWKEARQMLNEGQIALDPDAEPEPMKEELGPQKGPNSPKGPKAEQPSERIVKPTTRENTKEEQDMIFSLIKLRDEQALKERKLGEEILEEQGKEKK